MDGKPVECRLVPSLTAHKLRIKVKPNVVEVIVPAGRTAEEALAFVMANEAWTNEQLVRSHRLAALRRPEKRIPGHLPFRGETVRVHLISSEEWRAPNRVISEKGLISIICARRSPTPPARSLENWLRRQARDRIEQHSVAIAKRIRRSPQRILVMEQRTKWGNCSALGNLSFNWRLIMAPDDVLKYIVTHEMVHLVVPNHSQRFWLTVRSLCPEMDRSRQWLVANAHQLALDLDELLTRQT